MKKMTVNKQRRAAWLVFCIGVVVYALGFIASSLGYAKNPLSVCGLGIQFAGVVLMVTNMLATWNARRAGTPQR